MNEPEVEVESVSGDSVSKVVPLLCEFLREGEPLPQTFVAGIRGMVESGALRLFAARISAGEAEEEPESVGVLTLDVRPSFALGGYFASIEDLYVSPDRRGVGAGRALVRAAEAACADAGISYVEVQVEEEAAVGFYAAVGYRVEDVGVMSRSQVAGF